MEDSANPDDDIDFSIISPDNDKARALDFSVNDLLANPKPSEPSVSLHESSKTGIEAQQVQVNGSFMRDLGKMEQQLSYETNAYDIYEPETEEQEQPVQYTGTLQAKQESTCTRTINNVTKNVEKMGQIQFKHLILDFIEDRAESKEKSYQDYFQGSVLKTKKISVEFGSGASAKIKIKNKDRISQVNVINVLSTSRSSKNNKSSNSKKKLFLDQNKNIKSTNSYRSKSKSKSSLKSANSKSSLKSPIKSQKSQSRSKRKSQFDNKGKIKTIITEAYSQYYSGLAPPPVKKRANKSKSKGKKIIFSKTNVYSHC